MAIDVDTERQRIAGNINFIATIWKNDGKNMTLAIASLPVEVLMQVETLLTTTNETKNVNQ